MLKRFSIFSILGLLLLYSSCFKEDDRVTPHDPGDVKTVVIELTEKYKYQAYFDMGTDQVVSSNLKKAWDLGFECSNDGWHIILNSADNMFVAKTGLTDFNVQIDTTGFPWKFDKSDGNLDSTAIGSWFEYSLPDSNRIYTGEVYVINRGYDEAGNELGLRKIVFESLEDSVYTFRYAMLDGSGENTFSVKKDTSVSFTFFSFNEGGMQLTLEPPIHSWDLFFTQYTTIIYTNEGEPYPYLVTGALSNRVGVSVAKDTLHDFSSIDRRVAEGMDFSTDLDKIGYDWKDVDVDVNTGSATYNVIPGINYVVIDQEGFYYKLRFISFYDKGEKGYPTFEYQKL